MRTPERADDPLRPIRYRIYRDRSYEPSNTEARFLLERIRALEIARDKAEESKTELVERVERERAENEKLRGLLRDFDGAVWVSEFEVVRARALEALAAHQRETER